MPTVGYTVVYRIISLGSGFGKTTLGIQIVQSLAKQGIKAAVVKKTHEQILDPETDQGRYWLAGARPVVVAGPHETLIIRNPIGDLAQLVLMFWEYHPIVIAEGFRSSRVGKAIAIVESIEEMKHLMDEPGLWFIVSHDLEVIEKAKELGLNAILFDEADLLADEIRNDAISTLANMFPPGSDCRDCGYNTCVEFVEKLLTGEHHPLDCHLLVRSYLEVNGRSLPVDPKLEPIIAGLLEGLVKASVGAGVKPEEIVIKLKFKGCGD